MKELKEMTNQMKDRNNSLEKEIKQLKETSNQQKERNNQLEGETNKLKRQMERETTELKGKVSKL
jgi:hypothetical protein